MIVGSAIIMQQTRFHRDHHGAAADGDFASCRSGAIESRRHRLSFESRHIRSGQRLGGRPIRRPHHLPRRHRTVHARLDPLRAVRQSDRADRGAGAARPGRRHDGAGRAAGAVPQRGEDRADRHHGLSAGAGAAWPGARPADRRLHHHVFFLALDFSRQRAARPARHRAGDVVLRQSEGGDRAAAGLARLRAHRRVAVLHHVRGRGASAAVTAARWKRSRCWWSAL